MPNSRRRLAGQAAGRAHAPRRTVTRWLFASAGAVILATAIYLVVSPLRAIRAPESDASAPRGPLRQVVITMAGFTPTSVRIEAGRPFAVRVVNPDSPYHTDGGGWHQLRIEALGIDVRVPPRSEQIQAFPALQPGRYEFYCDLCCGGKDNPSMRGTFDVS